MAIVSTTLEHLKKITKSAMLFIVLALSCASLEKKNQDDNELTYCRHGFKTIKDDKKKINNEECDAPRCHGLHLYNFGT